MTLELNEYEAEVVRGVLSESLRLTGLGFENFDMDTNPETAAKVATMYVIVKKIEEAQ